MVSLSPAATTVTSVTSATPIVSAAAVATVRPGWRIALRRASPPATPPSAWAGRPSRPASPRAIRAGSRTRPEPGSAARSAATGGTRVARHAGTSPATSVTTVPSRSETTIVRVPNTVPASGSAIPIESKNASSAVASPSPATRPTADASTPSASASASTDPSTWRRSAPAIRRRPSSRVRCATVIESVLKIVNAPTSTATPPNTSSAMRMIEMNCSSPSSVNRSCSAAVVTVARGSARARSARSAAGSTPSEPATRIPSTRSPRPNSVAAASRSKTANVAVPIDSTVPKSAVPTTRKSCGSPRVVTVTVLPTGRSSSAAIPVSMTTSPGPAAQRPPERRNGVSASAPGVRASSPTPKYGPSPIGFPSRPMTFASSVMSAAATATPGDRADAVE